MRLKKVASKEDILSAEKNPYKKKPTEAFDARKYNGIMSFNQDALTIQKKLRKEWERHLSKYH